MYTCGPTVYAPQHLGNMRSQVFADLVRRAIETAGVDLTHVINITDVGHLTDDGSHGADKMEVAARERGQTALEIAREYERQWSEDRTALNCQEPTVLCRASEHIAEQIAIVEELEARGHTYQIDDGVYFDTSTFDRYANFAGLVLDALDRGRIESVDGKHNDADFALWKISPVDEQRLQEWDSPWGRGFPGWHIECTAMASKYLGNQFDVHTGGIDHVPVHHTNEIAQAECAFDVQPWVRLWMHNEFLNLSDQKMSKSKGDALTVGSVIERGHDPLAFRAFLLGAHYRTTQRFTWDLIDSSAVALGRLRKLTAPAIAEAGPVDAGALDALSEAGTAHRSEFWSHIDNDLNTGAALATTWNVAKDTALAAAERGALLLDFDTMLGLNLHVEEVVADIAPPIDESTILTAIDQRQQAKAEKRYDDADRIRDDLFAQGIELRDSADGVTWHVIR